MKKQKKKVYLAITLDNLELPIAIFLSVREGAIYSGLSKEHFCRAVAEGFIDYKNKCRYIKVNLDEDGEEDNE